MPPPPPEYVAVLLEKVELITVRVLPKLSMPPPNDEELPKMVEFVTVRMAP